MKFTLRKKKLFIWSLSGAMLLGTVLPLLADDTSTAQTFDFFLQEAQVTTASRRAQKISDSPVAIDVITAEDIAKSGAQNIADLLRYRVGMNVEEATGVEGNRQVVNVRGLPDEFAQSLLVLVDGRSIVSPEDEGVFWEDIPVALDDIERIEIVRGPNSALYGSNAGQGVINIITKKPGDDASLTAREEVGSYDSHRGYGSADLSTAIGDIRVSLQQSAREQSWPAPSGAPIADGNQDSNFLRANTRLDSKPWQGGELEAFVGGNKDTYSIPNVLGVSGSDYNSDYEMLKLTHNVNDGLSLELNGSRDDVNRGEALAIRETQYNGELLAHLSDFDERSQAVVGSSYRDVLDDSAWAFNEGVPGAGAQAGNHVGRVFASEAYSFTDWATLSAAASYEHSDTGGDQGAYQGALILKPVDDWSLRLSASQAPTLPSLLNRDSSLILPEGSSPNMFGPGTNANLYLHVGGSDMHASTVSSYEATVSGSLLDNRIGIDVTPYQMDIAGYPEFNTLNTVVTTPDGINYNVTQNLDYVNNYSIVARGVETALTFKPILGTKIEINHTYEDVNDNDKLGGNQRYFYTTPWNIVNGIINTELLWGFNAGLNINWTGQHFAYLSSRGTSVFVPDQARLDLRLGYTLFKGAEIYVLGQNMLQEYRVESSDGTAVPQAYYAGLNLAWGGN